MLFQLGLSVYSLRLADRRDRAGDPRQEQNSQKENMLRMLTRALVCTAVLTGSVLVADGQQEAMQLVEKAIVFAKANGKDKVLAEISTLKGTFDKGEIYVFAYDLNGVVLASSEKSQTDRQEHGRDAGFGWQNVPEGHHRHCQEARFRMG